MTLLQHFIPHHALSRLVGLFAACKYAPFKNRLIDWFIQRYGVNMQEALETNPHSYSDFNHFFTRALRPDARPIAPEGIICPVDGAISQLGDIRNGRIFQAKGMDYSLQELLGGSESLTTEFMGGKFATLYLAPKDYHRIHMPIDGTLQSMIHVPGRLFSVNAKTTDNVPRLFARNERVIAIFSTELGPMAIILVGAMIVASIHTVWHGQVTPPESECISTWHYDSDTIQLPRAAEMGHFQLGSTAIVLFPKDAMAWLETLQPGQDVRLGQMMGTNKIL
jgi:phosphatidylserine decarboxylase